MPDPIDVSLREIVTRFDKVVDQDVILEQIDGKEPAVATTLKNAENIFKSYAYLKKLYSGSISTRRVISCGTTGVGETLSLSIVEDVDEVELVNLSASDVMTVTINAETMTFPPLFSITLPVRSPSGSALVDFVPDTVTISGNVTYMARGGE